MNVGEIKLYPNLNSDDSTSYAALETTTKQNKKRAKQLRCFPALLIICISTEMKLQLDLCAFGVTLKDKAGGNCS